MLDISNIDKNSVTALLIRHAERFFIPENQIGIQTKLTPKGEKDAVIFGESLKNFSVNAIFTSPIVRCLQTSQNIVSGYQKNVKIIPTTILGNHSVFIENNELAEITFRNYSVFEVMAFFYAQKQVSGFFQIDYACKKLDDFIFQNTTQKGITLFISHDIFILSYIFYKTGKQYTSENWLDFLDGIKLTIK